MDDEAFEKIKAQYDQAAPVGARLISCLSEQLCELLEGKAIALGVPLEARIKRLSSLEEKFSRKNLLIEQIFDLDDFVGIRIILLFKSDLPKVGSIIKTEFDVASYEDTEIRLGESQFGYQSDHYVIRIKPDWEKVPTYKGLRELKAEVQVRTMAQHIWAAASHKLQYKQEENVPKVVLRSIHRVSALLETVDLEIDRLNEERNAYISSSGKHISEDVDLDVDIAAKILAELWPSKNLTPNHEEYNGLVSEFRHFGVVTSFQLKDFINDYKIEILKYEAGLIESLLTKGNINPAIEPKITNGYYFTQVALTRIALRKKFGEEEVNAVINCGARPHGAATNRRRRRPANRASPKN